MGIDKIEQSRAGGWREVFKIALPLIINGSAFTIMQFSDRVFLSRFSVDAIGAAMPAGSLSFTMICLVAMIAQYSGTFVAQYHGAGNRESCVKAAMHGIIFSFLSLPLFLLMIPLGHFIIGLFDHNPTIMELEHVYYDWMVYGGVFLSANWAVGGYFTGRSKLAPNVISSVIGCAVNIVLDYVLIFGYAGFPRWGLLGAAVATFIAGIVPFVIQLVWMMRDEVVKEVGYRNLLKINFSFMKQLLKFGIPSSMQCFLDMAGFTFFVMLTANLDKLSLTVSNIAFSINNLAFSPLLSIGAATAIVAAQYHGAGKFKEAKRVGWSGLKISWGYTSLIVIVFVFFPDKIIEIFKPESSEFSMQQLMDVGRLLMYTLALWNIFDAANIVFIGSLKGVGDTRFVMAIISLLSWLLWIPAEIYILKNGYGIVTAWFAMALYIMVLALLFIWRWQSERWTRFKLVNSEGI